MIRRIIADSGADRLELDGVEFRSVPLTISTDERSFTDDEHIDVSEMQSYLASYHGRSYTACPGVEQWTDSYAGADEVFVVTLSSHLSGAFNSARTAGAIYMEENPGTKVHVFDSLSAGPEETMLVDKIAECIRAGKDYDEVVRIGEDYRKHTRIFFALESFHNFAENGRVNKVVAAAAGMLGIRIMATGNPFGEIEIVAKCRGEANTLKTFLLNMEKAGYEGGKVYIVQCLNSEFAQKIKAAILEKYGEVSVLIYETRGLCSFYAEKGGILLGCECVKALGE